MRLKKLLLLPLLLCGLSAIAQEGSVARPKLVVGVVIDQMRWDYLYRYYNRYCDGGFKRLLNEGASCENAMLAHLPSYTAVGHTCIYTGSVPAIDGITSNTMVDQKTGKSFYCTDDADVRPIGTDSKDGMESPHNLWVSTVGDELRLATNDHSKVIGVSLKDRASILPAGRSANAAYWFDSKTGKFITSSYYMDKLPEWLEAFNAKKRVKALMSKPWNTLYDISTYTESYPDDNNYERPYFKGEKPVFPVNLPKLLKEQGYATIKSLPMGNTLTLEMAEATIEGEHLGTGNYTDFLAVSCSATDYVGHQFGVNAIETEDTYLRLDKDLSSFLNYLDEKIGKGNYTLFLTADHGAAHNYNLLKDRKLVAGAYDLSTDYQKLDKALTQKFGISKLVRNLDNYQINLDYDKIKSNNLDIEKVKEAAIECAKTFDGVLYVIDQTKIGVTSLPSEMKQLITNGYNPARSGEIQIMVKPGYYEKEAGDDELGTTHGTWAPYDLHIPLLFYGWGIKQGQLNREVHMTDIAPTVAALLHIQMPNGCVGKAIPEILESATLDK